MTPQPRAICRPARCHGCGATITEYVKLTFSLCSPDLRRDYRPRIVCPDCIGRPSGELLGITVLVKSDMHAAAGDFVADMTGGSDDARAQGDGRIRVRSGGGDVTFRADNTDSTGASDV
jgi:hypothetical protein